MQQPINTAVPSSPGGVRRRSADFSSLKNQIALSLEERDSNSKEKEARAELMKEVREHGGASGGSNPNRTTGKLQDFGKNLLGRAKKLKGSRVGAKDASGGDDDAESETEDGSKSTTASHENLRTVLTPSEVAAASKTDTSPRPMSIFPNPGGSTLTLSVTGFIRCYET